MYRYDLHVHTKEVSPCGKLTVEETVDLYKAKGYDGFWLTNHFQRADNRWDPSETAVPCPAR